MSSRYPPFLTPLPDTLLIKISTWNFQCIFLRVKKHHSWRQEWPSSPYLWSGRGILFLWNYLLFIIFKLKRHVGDQKIRKGVTAEPLISEDLNFVRPLHVYPICWDFFFKLIVQLIMPYFVWEDSKFSRMKPMVDRERLQCINLIWEITGEFCQPRILRTTPSPLF